MNVKLIEDPLDDVVDHVVESFWLIVERGDRGDDHRAHPRELKHVLEMNVVEWRLANDQGQLAALLEHYIRGAMNQILALARRDSSERPHTAGNHHHAAGEIGSAGNDRALILWGIAVRGHGLHFFHRVWRFVNEGT